MISFLSPERQNRGLAPSFVPKTTLWLSAPEDGALRAERDAVEALLAKTTGYAHAVALSSGFAALQIALKALRLPPGSECLVASPTANEAASVLRLKPLLLDPTSPLTATEVIVRLTPAVRAVVVSAPFGRQADLEAIRKVCAPAGVYVVEESVLGLPKGKQNAALLSFSACSLLSVPGQMGALLTDDPIMATRAREARGLWQADADLMSCALIQAKLPKLPSWLSLRRSIAQWYLAAFETEFVRGRIGLPAWPENPATHAWEQFAVGTAEPQKLKEKLLREGVETNVPLAGKPFLALPLYPELSGKEVQFVVERMQSCLNRASTSSSISL